MAAIIKAATVVTHPVTGEPVALKAGDECSDILSGLITNPEVLDQPKAARRRRAKDDDREG